RDEARCRTARSRWRRSPSICPSRWLPRWRTRRCRRSRSPSRLGTPRSPAGAVAPVASARPYGGVVQLGEHRLEARVIDGALGQVGVEELIRPVPTSLRPPPGDAVTLGRRHLDIDSVGEHGPHFLTQAGPRRLGDDGSHEGVTEPVGHGRQLGDGSGGRPPPPCPPHAPPPHAPPPPPP